VLLEKKQSVENQAVAIATAFYAYQGFHVEDVSRKRGHAGYDLLLTRDGDVLRIEVKGCTRPYGIPDPYYSEFDPNTKLLIADFLCVVYLFPGKPTEIAVIPREAIPPDFVQVKLGYRISGKFENERTMRHFLVNFR
jgi:hypothetical protein